MQSEVLEAEGLGCEGLQVREGEREHRPAGSSALSHAKNKSELESLHELEVVQTRHLEEDGASLPEALGLVVRGLLLDFGVPELKMSNWVP